MTEIPNHDLNPRPAPGREWLWLVVVFLVLYGRLLLGWAPSGGDLINQYLPYQQLVKTAIRSGDLPLYNSMTFCGRPLMADIQVGVLYPPNWLHWLLPLPLSFALVVALHGALQLWGCWRFGRALGLAPVGIVLGATLFAASPFFMLKNFTGVVLFLYAGAWWPWLAWGFISRRWGLLPWLFALSLLAGSPQITYYGWLAVGALALVWPQPDARTRLRDWALLAGCGAVGLGLAAIQTAQTYFFIQHSFERGGGGAGWEYITDGSLAPRLLWLLVNPALLGDYTRQEELYWGKPPDFAEGCYFLPVWSWALLPALALALITWKTGRDLELRRRRALVLLCALGGLLAVALAMGQYSPVFKAAYAAFPGFNRFRVPARLMSLWTAGVALLSALAVDALARSSGERKGWQTICLGGGFVGIGLPLVTLLAREQLWAWLKSPLSPQNPGLAQILADMRAQVAWHAGAQIVCVVLAVACVLLFARHRRNAWLYALSALALAQLWHLSHTYQTVTRFNHFTETHYPPTALVQLLQTEAKRGRVLWLDDVNYWQVDQNQPEIYPNRLIMHGLPDARGYDPVNARWIGEWMNLLAGRAPQENPRGFMFVPQIARPAWLTLMGVEIVISYQDLAAIPGLKRIAAIPFKEGALNLYRNEAFRGMAYLAPMPRIVNSDAEALYASAGLADTITTEPLRTITLNKGAISADLVGSMGEGEITPLDSRNHRFSWRVRAARPALFCFAQSAWPGWNASIDGDPAAWSPLSGTFLALQVPDGEHVVQFEFVPEGLVLGRWISALSLLLLAYLGGRRWWQRRGSESPNRVEPA